MVFKVLGKVFEKVHEKVYYEIDRGRRLFPTMVRFGISRAEDWLLRFAKWKGVPDHTPKRRKRRR